MAVVVAANGADHDQVAAAAAAAATASASDGNARRPAEAVDVDPRLLMAARSGNSELLKNLLLLLDKQVDEEAGGSSASLLPRVTMEGDTLLHVVAACGDGDGDGDGDAGGGGGSGSQHKFLECVSVIVRSIEKKGGAAAVRLALKARNNSGDTPLHCAAGAGNANMISCLIDLIANNNGDGDGDEAVAAMKKALVRMENQCGETALHHAVRAADKACIDRLMAVDSDLACIPPHDDEEGSSALYLAISMGELEIAQHLYRKTQGKLSYSGPDGRNVLHAAVSRGQALRMILQWFNKDVRTTNSGSSVAAAPDDLLSQLSGQRDRKQNGSTPLHLAASLAEWPGARPQVWPTSEETARLLLDANKSTAYQADDEGSYPIHVAAWSRRGVRTAGAAAAVVKLLLERCPDCATLRDGKGRTFLHVAAEQDLSAVVRYVVSGEMPQRLSSMILNAQDSNGDTALHGAVRAGNLAVFNCLLRNRQVRLDVANKDGMTPLGLALTMIIPEGSSYIFNRRSIVLRSLLHAGAPYGGGRQDLFFAKHPPAERYLDKESKKHTEATQAMSIVTALIATVTFASAFTFPGGYRGDGEPVLAGSYAFDAFILADTLAFICSISATLSLAYAGVPAMDISIRFGYFKLSTALMHSAAMSLVAAFGLGLYLVLALFHRTSASTIIAAFAIVFASSLYGIIEVWRIIRMATTVLARTGIRRLAVVRHYATWIFFGVLANFWSYLIIFGVPALRKTVHQKQL